MKKRTIHKWTDEDIRVLTENINRWTWDRLADRFGVTVTAVKRKAGELKLKKIPVLRKPHSKNASRPHREDQLREMYHPSLAAQVKNPSDEGKIPLKIDSKTTIMIRADQDPEEVRAKYRKG